jgi:hypothetical protein
MVQFEEQVDLPVLFENRGDGSDRTEAHSGLSWTAVLLVSYGSGPGAGPAQGECLQVCRVQFFRESRADRVQPD